MGFPHVTLMVPEMADPEGGLNLLFDTDCVVDTQNAVFAQLMGHTFIVQSFELQVRDKPRPYRSEAGSEAPRNCSGDM